MTTVRLASPDDAAACREIYAPYVRDTAVTFEVAPPDTEQFRERMRTTLQTYPWLVCERAGTVAGYAYASQHRERDAYQWAVEVSVYVDNEFQRGGVGERLYDSLFSILERQGYYDAYAGITLPNDPSRRFHEAMGFEPVGVYSNVGFKAGSWRDVEWFHQEIQTHDDDPEPPTELSELTDSVDLQSVIVSEEH